MELSLAILAVLSCAWAAGYISHRLGYPAMLGELLVGILLGPPLLGWLPRHSGLTQLADVGIFLMMLYIGTEIDPKELFKASRSALLTAIGGFVIPFVAGFAVTYLYLDNSLPLDALERTWRCVAGGLFVGSAVGVTALAANSRILLDLKLLDTRIALVMMTGALFADTAALVIFAGITGFHETQGFRILDLALVSGNAVLFFAASVFIGAKIFPLVPKLLRRMGFEHRSVVFTTILIVAFGVGELAHLLGLHSVIGAFMAGMFLKKCTANSKQFLTVSHILHDISMGFLAPIFFVTAAYEFSFDAFTSDLGFLIVVCLVAIVGKILGTVLFYLPSGNGWREGLAIGFGMNGRGAVEIIVAGIGLKMGLISETIFSILVFMAIFTTALVPVTLKWTTDWLHRRGELERVKQRSGILVLGMGPVARLLASCLKGANEVKMIGNNNTHCSLAKKEAIEFVYGNMLSEEILTLAGGFKAKTAIVLTPDFETNLITSNFLKENFHIPEINIHISGKDSSSYLSLVDKAHSHTLFGGSVELTDWDRWIALGRYTRKDIELQKFEDIAALKETISIQTCLPLLVARNQEALVFHEGLSLQTGDRVAVLFPESEDIIEIDRFDELIADCKILDVDKVMGLGELLGNIAEHLSTDIGMSRPEILAAYEARENIGGTVFGRGLAIPHIKLEGRGRAHILVVRSKQGIIFSENHTVYAVFALASSFDMRNLHLRILSAIAQIAQAEKFQTKWIEAQDVEALRKLLLSARRRRF